MHADMLFKQKLNSDFSKLTVRYRQRFFSCVQDVVRVSIIDWQRPPGSYPSSTLWVLSRNIRLCADATPLLPGQNHRHRSG